jgi:Family of unknown function (DUF5681)
MTKKDDKPKRKPTGDYPVGFARPPVSGQFAKGQSGNRKGRKKGGKNYKTDVRDTLKEPVTVTINGIKRKVSAQQATLMRLREKALSGDARAIDQFLKLAQLYNEEEFVREAEKELSVGDSEILKLYNQHVIESNAASSEDDIEEAWRRSGLGDDDPETGDDKWLN